MSQTRPKKSATDGANFSVESCAGENRDDGEVYQLTAALSAAGLDNNGATTVSFAGRQLKLNNEGDAKEVIEAIEKCQDMQRIMLEGNTIGIEAAKAIGKALENKKSLKDALLKDMFTGRLKTEVPEAVRFMTAGIALSGASLYELDLSDNAFGPIGMQALAPFLEGNSCRDLKVLRLNNNGLGVGGGTILSQCLPSLVNLKIFICGRNRLCSSSDSENADASPLIGEALAKLFNLEHIEMPQNGIREPGIKAIASAVQVNTKLRVLNLNDNIITGDASSDLAIAIKNNQGNLENINLGDCLLRVQGGIRIVNALNQCKSISCLREIEMSGNELGGEYFVEALLDLCKREDKHPELSILLSSNNFGDDAIDFLKIQLPKDNVDLILTDDEGTADEDEEQCEDEEDDEDYVDEEEPQEEQVKLEEVSPAKESPAKKALDELADVLQNADTSVDKLCELFVNVSIESFDCTNGTLDETGKIKTELLLDSAKKKSKNSFDTANALLGHMGLLKLEDSPKKKVEKDLRGPFLALATSAQKLDKTEKEVFQLFLGTKPSKAAETAGKFKHRLMQSLYM